MKTSIIILSILLVAIVVMLIYRSVSIDSTSNKSNSNKSNSNSNTSNGPTEFKLPINQRPEMSINIGATWQDYANTLERPNWDVTSKPRG